MCNAKCVIMKVHNPFIISGYISPTFFCDREKEHERIVSAVKNGRNITILSLRRIGKTGLIKHVFHHLAGNENLRILYFDIMPTSCLSEFVREFAKSIIVEEQKRSGSYLKKITQLLSGIRGKLSFNQLTGAPELEIDYRRAQESEKDIAWIFQYLAAQKEQIVIAIDEFQQIVSYPEKNVEALLRAYCQQLNNVSFIFSGSSKHLLSSMFSEYGRPFYQSSDILFLERINKEQYADFIFQHFKSNKRNIAKEWIDKVLEEYDCYTFYVQFFFNKLFATEIKEITPELITEISQEILREREGIYYNYKNLLTNNQFALLKAIAKEGKVLRPNSGEFIHKYRLTQPSSINRSLKSLLDKEMIYEERKAYRVYDLFFSKWLAQL